MKCFVLQYGKRGTGAGGFGIKGKRIRIITIILSTNNCGLGVGKRIGIIAIILSANNCGFG